MCIAVPARIVEMQGELAVVDLMGNRRRVDLTLVDGAQTGDYVLVHAGYAIQKIHAEDAEAALRLFGEMDRAANAESGD